jgi:hypothetical protein
MASRGQAAPLSDPVPGGRDCAGSARMVFISTNLTIKPPSQTALPAMLSTTRPQRDRMIERAKMASASSRARAHRRSILFQYFSRS